MTAVHTDDDDDGDEIPTGEYTVTTEEQPVNGAYLPQPRMRLTTFALVMFLAWEWLVVLLVFAENCA
jgi:hypothetical protein